MGVPNAVHVQQGRTLVYPVVRCAPNVWLARTLHPTLVQHVSNASLARTLHPTPAAHACNALQGHLVPHTVYLSVPIVFPGSITTRTQVCHARHARLVPVVTLQVLHPVHLVLWACILGALATLDARTVLGGPLPTFRAVLFVPFVLQVPTITPT